MVPYYTSSMLMLDAINLHCETYTGLFLEQGLQQVHDFVSAEWSCMDLRPMKIKKLKSLTSSLLYFGIDK